MNSLKSFEIASNEYLSRNIVGYFNRDYTGFEKPNNPDFLNILKNTFNKTSSAILNRAQRSVENIISQDVPKIMEIEGIDKCVVVCVPRAKCKFNYTQEQLQFLKAVSNAAKSLENVVDSTKAIIRIEDTFTTHLKKATERGVYPENNGSEPYPGITKKTCSIAKELFENQVVILVDDIYTKTINIDEDCIQALLDNGARKVIFYAVGKTRRSV